MNRVEEWAVAVMDGIRVCLGEQLDENSRAGAVCFLGLYTGQQVAADHCGCGNDGCGMAWVRLVRAFSSTQFPTPDVQINPSAPMAVLLEVGALRCIPVGKSKTPPSEVEQINATLSQLSDMEAIRHALGCCEVLANRDTALGSYSPLSSGDCGGGAWQVTVQLRPTGGRDK